MAIHTGRIHYFRGGIFAISGKDSGEFTEYMTCKFVPFKTLLTSAFSHPFNDTYQKFVEVMNNVGTYAAKIGFSFCPFRLNLQWLVNELGRKEEEERT